MKTALFTLLVAAAAFAQSGQPTCAAISPAAAKLQFDAASVKPAGPYTGGPLGGIAGGPGSNDPGRITAAHIALANLLTTAYDLWTDQVSGPDWMKDAINNGFAITATMPATTTKEEYCGMLRNLLTERFHLTLRHETQPRPGFELTALPGGPKFKKYNPQDPGLEAMPGTRSDKNGFPLLPPARPTALSFSMRSDGLTKESFRNDMALFARGLGNAINQSSGLPIGSPLPRVADKTGLAGVYDIRFEYAGTPMNLPRPSDAAAGPAAAPDPADVGPNIFSAVQQLGLKLQKVKDIQVEVLIVEHADQTPAEKLTRVKAALLTILAAASLFAQSAATTCAAVSPAAAKLEFDAASVKLADPGQPRIAGRVSGGPGTSDPGRVTASRISLASLIYQAYALMNDQLTGPDWMRDADTDGFAITAIMASATTLEEYCGMLRNLLASRFRLSFHIEKQPRPGFELTVLSGGPKFKKYIPDAASAEPDGPGISLDARGFGALSPSAPTGLITAFSPGGMVRLAFRNDMNAFAAGLGNDINISDGIRNGSPIPRVIDKTGLSGTYDLHLEFARPDATPPDDAGAHVFTAIQQQLGLKLQKVKDTTVDVLIVDRVDQTPTAN